MFTLTLTLTLTRTLTLTLQVACVRMDARQMHRLRKIRLMARHNIVTRVLLVQLSCAHLCMQVEEI